MGACHLAVLVLAVSVVSVTAWPWSWRPYSSYEDLNRLAERALDRRSEATESDSLPEVENYDLSVPTTYGCWFIFVYCDRKRAITDARSDLPAILASEAELKAYRSPDDIKELQSSPVIKVERYERPLAEDASSHVKSALEGKQSGVVATLHDGRKFLIVKGNQHGEGRRAVLILANHMTSDWVKTGSNDVSRSTLADFIKAAGLQYNVVSDNGNAAADRMMALP